MADYTLTEKPPLGHYVRTLSNVTLTEVTDLSILSIATPLGGEKKRDASFKKLGFGPVRPARSAAKGDMRLIGMTHDQHFLVYGGTPDLSLRDVYVTDQTHNWVAIRAEGENIWPALERLCMLDLHPQVYNVDDALRFDIETMYALMVKEEDNQVLIMGASSSARSFLHAIETALLAVA